MTWTKPNYFVFYLAVFAVTAAVWFAVGLPLRNLASAELQAASEARDRGLRLVSTLSELEAQKAAAAADASFDGLWRAASPGAATAIVQAHLTELAMEADLVLRSIAPIDADPLPLVSALAFRIEGEASLDKLLGFLLEAEYSAPLLSFERGTVRRLNRVQSGEQPQVFFQFEVIAPYELEELEP